MFEKKITDDVHLLLKSYIKEGMTACDLTVGNGYDTIYLAKSVGFSGKVFGFDIQDEAISRVGELLKSLEYNDVQLICADHSTLKNYVSGPFHIGMMNLGYLPGGDKNIVTRWDTTKKAIDSFLDLLRDNGILSIVAYKSHDNHDEYNQLKKYLEELAPKDYQVRSIAYVNRANGVPEIFLIRKK